MYLVPFGQIRCWMLNFGFWILDAGYWILYLFCFYQVSRTVLILTSYPTINKPFFKKETPIQWNHQTKLLIKDPTIKYHPSTSTNSSSLKGREIIIGGSIIMPIESNTQATTISRIKNGTYIRNPI